MLEAIAVACLVHMFPTEAIWLCALQAFFLGIGNVTVRPCTMPWDHWLMGFVMFQEGIWYALVAMYGADAPPLVVVFLNWSNLSSTMTLVCIALEPLLEMPFDAIYSLVLKLIDRWNKPSVSQYSVPGKEEAKAEEEDEEEDAFEEYRRRVLLMPPVELAKHLHELENSPVFDQLSNDEKEALWMGQKVGLSTNVHVSLWMQLDWDDETQLPGVYYHERARDPDECVLYRTASAEDHNAAIQLQALHRGRMERKRVRELKRKGHERQKRIEKEKKEQEEEDAATRLQALLRGAKARKQTVQRRKAKREEELGMELIMQREREIAVIRIQAAWRGRKGRKVAEHHHKSICLIQSLHRGKKDRKRATLLHDKRALKRKADAVGEVDRFEKSFFRRELCIRGNTLSHRERCNYLATLDVPGKGSVLTQMEVGSERKEYLWSLNVDDRAELLEFLTDDQIRELMTHLTIDDHVARIARLPLHAEYHFMMNQHKYLRSLTEPQQVSIMNDKWKYGFPSQGRAYLDHLDPKDKYHRLGLLTQENRAEYFRAMPTFIDILSSLDDILAEEMNEMDRAFWSKQSRAVVRDKVSRLEPAEVAAALHQASETQKSLLVSALTEAQTVSLVEHCSPEDKVVFIRGLTKGHRDAYMAKLLKKDQATLTAMLISMGEQERVEYLLQIEIEDAASLLQRMPEADRVACLRHLPIATQVQILRAFDEGPRTAYLRYLGENAPKEREAVGRGMMAAMSREERKQAWNQRKVMGEVTAEQGRALDETAVTKDDFAALTTVAKAGGALEKGSDAKAIRNIQRRASASGAAHHKTGAGGGAHHKTGAGGGAHHKTGASGAAHHKTGPGGGAHHKAGPGVATHHKTGPGGGTHHKAGPGGATHHKTGAGGAPYHKTGAGGATHHKTGAGGATHHKTGAGGTTHHKTKKKHL